MRIHSLTDQGFRGFTNTNSTIIRQTSIGAFIYQELRALAADNDNYFTRVRAFRSSAPAARA